MRGEGLSVTWSQKITMLIGSRFTLLDMQRVLERDLGIDLCPIKLWDGILHSLEVEKIERIAECIEKALDTLAVDVSATLHLKTLDMT